MLDYSFLLALAIILLSTKVLGLLTNKVHLTAVVGALFAGILIGPNMLGIVSETEFIQQFAELGVIMLMFLAGLDTNVKEIKKTGVASLIIAIFGVVLPFAGGFIFYKLYFPNVEQGAFIKAVFLGVVLTATSVSITVEALQEMGKLKGRVGTAILGAAVIDDIIGIIILTLAMNSQDSSVNPLVTVGEILLFFVFVAIVGFVTIHVFRLMENRYHQKRRITVLAVVFCLYMSYCAEELFGVADITGAYFAGVILCTNKEKVPIENRLSVVSYLIFTPVFFANVGISTKFGRLDTSMIIFTVIFLAIAVITKIVGCGLAALLFKFKMNEAVCIGIGMISRGEVALIIAQKGMSAGIINEELFTPIVIMVVITTFIAPILLKIAFKSDKSDKPVKAET